MTIGFALAWFVGFKRRNLLPNILRPIGSRLYAMAANKYYVDETYERFVIGPFFAITRGLFRFDQRVIDACVNGVGSLGMFISRWKESFDRLVVDRIVNGIAQTVRGFGAVLRLLQTGVIQQYLFVVVAAIVVLSVFVRR